MLYYLYWILGAVIYLIIAGFTFGFVVGSFASYDNFKSFSMAVFWPIAWLGMLGGAFWHWISKK